MAHYQGCKRKWGDEKQFPYTPLMESHNNWVQYKVYEKKPVDMISGMQKNILEREFWVIMHIFKSNLELIKGIIATINQIESVITWMFTAFYAKHSFKDGNFDVWAMCLIYPAIGERLWFNFKQS